MEQRERTFANQDILLDGGTFTGCSFRNCRMVFHGTALPKSFSANSVEGCEWVFGGAALTTLQFLTLLYKGTGDGGRQLIEDTFDNIRRGLK